MSIYDSDNQILQSKYFNVDGPLVVAYDITNKCNFKCLHCYNDSGKRKDDELTDEEVLSLMQQIATIRPIVVCFCGGEPLIRAKLIIDCLKVLKNNVGAINMVSNGYLLTEQLAKSFKQYGLSAIQFSLDGINALQHDTFRGVRGSYEHVINAIHLAQNAGLTVDVAISPNKLNYKCISEYIDFCYDLGIRGIRSMPLIPMGRGGKINHLILSPNEYIYYQQILQIKKENYQFEGLKIEWGDPVDHLVRMPANSSLGIKTYSLEIKSNGDIGASTYFPIRFGNLRKHTIKEYWENGFDNVWANPNFLKYIGNVITVNDIGGFMPERKGNAIHIELIR
ncbi:hypothetical protein B7R76_04270 [Mageeibacillus indolicus]|uniref:Radical SAM core domain-containing protein n=1 Tax=Mageeibacillus indolicus TaxID=884684 RepID=A0A2J8B210_9FIRM|nr:radical SAM protein [Mageeibacillus indolicus]PNH18776.1 hypothetical protein B7R76_04270 [Mageeibacillus indolicus]